MMSGNVEWQDFEKKVTSLFELKGFTAEPDMLVEGRQTDVWLTSKEEYIGSILVECKHRKDSEKGSVGVDEVEAFLARVTNLRSDGKINCGYLVTNASFTNKAKLVVSRSRSVGHVFLKTYDELLNSIIDFSSYLRSKVEEYKGVQIFNEQYLPLSCEDASSSEFQNLDEKLVKFSETNSGANILILTGDYGVGKTTSTRKLHYELAKKYIETKGVRRVPCYLSLKNYYHSGSSKSLINQFLSEEVGHSGSSWTAFTAMNKAGHITLILDGFDEMAQRVSRDVRERCFTTLAELCQPKSRTIISGRPNYFSGDEELKETASLLRSRSAQENIIRLVGNQSKIQSSDGKPIVSFVRIAPLSQDQIKDFIRARIVASTNEKKDGNIEERTARVVAKIEEIYNLRELAERPILLEMIYATLHDIENDRIGSVVDLYEKYTSAWLEIERGKGEIRGLLGSKDRLFFTLHLAWLLFGDTGSIQIRIHYKELSNFVVQHFDLEDRIDIDYHSSDVQMCGFLRRNDDGFYEFAHRSFFEYFCARYIGCYSGLCDADLTSSLRLQRAEKIKLSNLWASLPGVFRFLDHMFYLPLNPDFWKGFIIEFVEGSMVFNEIPNLTTNGECLQNFPLEDFLGEVQSTIDVLIDGDISLLDLPYLNNGLEDMKSKMVLLESLIKDDQRFTPALRIFEYFRSQGFRLSVAISN